MWLVSRPGGVDEEIHFPAGRVAVARDRQDLGDIGLVHLHAGGKCAGISKQPTVQTCLQVESHGGCSVTHRAVMSDKGAWRQLDVRGQVIPPNFFSCGVRGRWDEYFEILRL